MTRPDPREPVRQLSDEDPCDRCGGGWREPSCRMLGCRHCRECCDEHRACEGCERMGDSATMVVEGCGYWCHPCWDEDAAIAAEHDRQIARYVQADPLTLPASGHWSALADKLAAQLAFERELWADPDAREAFGDVRKARAIAARLREARDRAATTDVRRVR